MQRTAPLSLALLFAPCVAFAVQFRAENYAIPWSSSDGAVSLVSANAPINGWTAPALVRGGGVSFAATTDGVPTPLGFGDEATGTVAVAVLVVDCTDTPSSWSTPAWNRSWPGRIYEVVLLEEVPLGESKDALRAYLSAKWGLGLGIPSAQNARTILRRLGVKSDPLYSSVIFAR